MGIGILAVLLVSGQLGRQIPGLPSKSSKGDVELTRKQVDVEPRSAAADLEKALAELKVLIEEAQALREELEQTGTEGVSAKRAKRLAQIEKSVKKLKALTR
ncbi:MAG: hypothetical protein K2Q23_02580 [Bryobacteraceae bacterium]|nr:hypothetical protein [Bryobacteraceae bacterium]